MDVLGSPLESLVFGLYLLTTAQSFWTWVAVFLAAGFSCWRIRTVGSLSRLKSNLSLAFHNRRDDAPSRPQPLDRKPSLSLGTKQVRPAEDDGTRKGKFTVYYEKEDVEDNREVTATDGCSGGVGVGGLRLTEVEGLVRLSMKRKMQLDFCQFQDLTVLNGNVVRLWEGNRPAAAVASSRVCVPSK